MNEEAEARDAALSRAALKALETPAPEDLKEALRRLARRRAEETGPGEALRALFACLWRPAACAAFAAAGLALVPRRAEPPPPPPAAAPADPVERLAAELWTDDDGRDDES